jgi:hypothetical protein
MVFYGRTGEEIADVSGARSCGAVASKVTTASKSITSLAASLLVPSTSGARGSC